jgi:hypothetical protein
MQRKNEIATLDSTSFVESRDADYAFPFSNAWLPAVVVRLHEEMVRSGSDGKWFGAERVWLVKLVADPCATFLRDDSSQPYGGRVQQHRAGIFLAGSK